MNPKCARCTKTVYPVEKLSCLDKAWHKGCFSCEICKMTLTMKNYKGYDKKPYCTAHYPTTKFTAVADTPENKRLKENTKKQSNVQYHKDFEASRGHYIAVTDDPEMKRAQRSSEIASQVAYTQHSSGQSRLGIQQRTANEAKEIQTSQQRRLSHDHPMAHAPQYPRYEPEPAPPPSAPISTYAPVSDDQTESQVDHEADSQTESQADCQGDSQAESLGDSQGDSQTESKADCDGNSQVDCQGDSQTESKAVWQGNSQVDHQADSQIESQADCDGNSQVDCQGDSQTESKAVWQGNSQVDHQADSQTESQADCQGDSQADCQGDSQVDCQGDSQRYRALYDYSAADDDEVSFMDGDLIVDVTVIDDGWWEGRVERTGQYGMLPSNYVEEI